jgi:hypothetical protein
MIPFFLSKNIFLANKNPKTNNEIHTIIPIKVKENNIQ